MWAVVHLKSYKLKQPDTLPHSKLVVKNKVESTIICVSSRLANIRRCCAKSAMNRKGPSNLFEEVASIDNLRRASERAMENADHETVSMRDFKEHKEERLQELHDLLISGNYQTGKYYKFTVYEPKERVICALPFYPDRIVHHARMQVLLPIW